MEVHGIFFGKSHASFECRRSIFDAEQTSGDTIDAERQITAINSQILERSPENDLFDDTKGGILISPEGVWSDGIRWAAGG